MGQAAWRLYERRLAYGSAATPGPGPDGLPIPPARLRVTVCRGTDPDVFLRSGAAEAAAIVELLAKHDAELVPGSSVLDFGCGCGRVARHWPKFDGLTVAGCDYNPELVAWCRTNLPFMSVADSNMDPPLPFSGPFNLVYAISVFTHLAEPAQRSWIEECARVLVPDGLLLFTTHGARFRDGLDHAERARFDAGGLATRFPESEGSNLCSVFHPDPFLDRMLDGFDRVESVRSALPGVDATSPLGAQDIHLIRKTMQP